MIKLKYFLVCFLFFASCKKNNNDSSSITGQWEWFKATGGIGNVYQTPQSSGRSWQLTLNPDFSVSQTGDLMPGGDGTYTLTEETNQNSTRQLLNISSNGELTTFSYTFVSNTILRLDQNVETDGLSYFLVRE
ncbi:MAG: hypothetical protein ABIN36_16365 [Ferruginibacter sp.]